MPDVNTPRTTDQIKADQQTIKAKMPQTYKYIQDTVARCGADVFKNVNRGLAGEANRFYAFENEVLIGTPFTKTDIMQTIINAMMQNGAKCFCVLVEPVKVEVK
jgi:hypothetical protein